MTEPVSVLHECRAWIGQRFNFIVKITLKQFEEFCHTAASRYGMCVETKIHIRLCQPQEQVIQVADQPAGLRADTIGIIRHSNRHTIHRLVEQIGKVETCIDGQL